MGAENFCSRAYSKLHEADMGPWIRWPMDDGLARRENTELRRASFALGKVQQDGARSFSNLESPDFCYSPNSLFMSWFLKLSRNLLVIRSPSYVEPPLTIRMYSCAENPRTQLDRVPEHRAQAAPLLQLRHCVPDPRHVAGVKEVEDAGRERKLAELELDAGALQPLPRGVPALRALPRPGLVCS